MIFKHRYFKLDTESKKVFDENNKELALTGNAYRLLAYLCDKKNASLTDINDFFDPAGAKEYTENHVRQYRHKINSFIGYDVVAYKNNIYSINDSMPIETPQRKWKKFSKKEKVVISSSVILLILYGIFALGNKNRAADSVAKTISLEQTSANSTPKPQDDMILIPTGEFLMGSTEQEVIDAWHQND